MKINLNALERLLDESAFYDDMYAFLEGVIDEELSKDESEMDCELIDECSQLLLAMSEEGQKSALLIPLVSSKNIMKKASERPFLLGKGLKIAIAAALIIATGLGTNAVIARTSGVDYLSEFGAAIYEKLEELGIISDSSHTDPDDETQPVTDKDEKEEDEKDVPSVSEISAKNENKAENEDKKTQTSTLNPVISLRLSFSPKFKTEYLWGEELNLEGLTVYGIHRWNRISVIPVDKCAVSGYSKVKAGTQKITVTYGKVSACFDVTVVKTTNKEDRVVTGIDVIPPQKTVYTTEDTSISLVGMQVRYIYSDGTYSGYFGTENVAVISEIDFSQPGEQTVNVKIKNQWDYSFAIQIVEPEQKDSGIDHLEFYSVDFNVGEDIFSGNKYFTVYFKEPIYSGSRILQSERVFFKGNEATVKVRNLDTSSPTIDRRYMTIEYKGNTLTVAYTVSYQKLVISSLEMEGDFKRLYYKGEPLCYGLGEKSSKRQQLTSYNLDCSGFPDPEAMECFLQGSLSVSIKVIFINGVTKELHPNVDCEFKGYDPDKEGFQTISIYYEGTYITSYTVFVYGDEGYVPVDNPGYTIINNHNIDLSSAGFGTLASYKKKLSYNETKWVSFTPYFLNVTGGGTIGTTRFDCLKRIETTGITGVATVYSKIKDTDIEFPYEVKVIRSIKSVSFDDGTRQYLDLNVKNLTKENYGNRKLILTFYDNSTEEYTLNEAAKYYETETHQRITPDSALKGAYGTVYYYIDEDFYFPYSPNKTTSVYDFAYFYNEGYEDSVKLIATKTEYDSELDKSVNREVNYLVFGSSDTERKLTWNYHFSLSTPNGTTGINGSAWSEGIEWGVEGVYEATVYAERNDKIFSLKIPVYIGDNYATPHLDGTITKAKRLYVGQEFDPATCVNCELTYIDLYKQSHVLSSGDYTVTAVKGVTNGIIDSTARTNGIMVKVEYVNENGEHIKKTQRLFVDG